MGGWGRECDRGKGCISADEDPVLTFDLSPQSLASLTASDNLNDAVDVLREVYGASAGLQAIERSFIAERDGDRDAALFWASVYASVATSDLPTAL